MLLGARQVQQESCEIRQFSPRHDFFDFLTCWSVPRLRVRCTGLIYEWGTAESNNLSFRHKAGLFSYGDTQRYRLGVNFNSIPVNAPKCPFHSYHRDGKMRVDGNLGATTNFNPNSAGLWDNQPDFAEPPLPIDGAADHHDHRPVDDHWEQPGNLFRLMTPTQQQALFDNTARAMGDARQPIKERHIANCRRADPAYGEGVARALGLNLPLAAE